MQKFQAFMRESRVQIRKGSNKHITAHTFAECFQSNIEVKFLCRQLVRGKENKAIKNLNFWAGR